MAIKIFSLISLIPLCYIINKVRKRLDLNAFDIFLSFQLLYLAIIPLVSNTDDIMYEVVRNDFSTQLITFLQINVFIYSILFIDIYYTHHREKRKTVSILDITKSIRICTKKYILRKKSFILIYIILAILISDSIINTASGDDVLSLYEIRDLAKERNTTFGLMYSSVIVYLRPLLAILISIITIQRKDILKSKHFLVILVLSGIVIMMGARTWLFEFFVLMMLVFYSNKKDTISYKTILLFGFIGTFIITIIFPFISVFKYAKKDIAREMTTGSSSINVIKTTIEYIYNDIESFNTYNNTSQRKWYIYQIVGLSASSDYQGNGNLTMKSISYSTPRVIFPNKDMGGSQIAIEKGLKVNKDVADSILLFGIVENKHMGFMIATFIVLLIFQCYHSIYDFFYLRWRDPLVLLFIQTSFFIILDQPEWSVDKFIPTILYTLVVSMIIVTIIQTFSFRYYFIHKLRM